MSFHDYINQVQIYVVSGIADELVAIKHFVVWRPHNRNYVCNSSIYSPKRLRILALALKKTSKPLDAICH